VAFAGDLVLTLAAARLTVTEVDWTQYDNNLLMAV
jgi:hypothetical protein